LESDKPENYLCIPISLNAIRITGLSLFILVHLK
jgi:hypothetical protein